MTSVNIFEDMSAGSFLLQKELKERGFKLRVIRVYNKNLVDWFTKVGHNEKTYLHFCFEDYIENHEELRKQVDKVERLGFRNDIVKEYEGLDRKTMLWRAKKAGYEEKPTYEVVKAHAVIEKPYIELPEPTGQFIIDRSSKAYIKQIGDKFRPDPDTEMKDLGDFKPQLTDSDSDKIIDEAINENKKDKPKKKRKLFTV